VTQNIFISSIGGKGCKEGHKFVKKITKKDKKGDESFERGEYQIAIDSWWEAMNADMSLLAFVRPTLLKVVKAHLCSRRRYGRTTGRTRLR